MIQNGFTKREAEDAVTASPTCYVGTSTPDATLGADGDIYIMKEATTE